MTCSLHFKIFNYNVVISNVFFSLAKDIFRFKATKKKKKNTFTITLTPIEIPA